MEKKLVRFYHRPDTLCWYLTNCAPWLHMHCGHMVTNAHSLIHESTKAYIYTCTHTQQHGRIQRDKELQETALTPPSQWSPLPQFLSHFSLPPPKEVAPLSDRSMETSQSGGRCHNKQKQHSNPPKSNQEPLIHALNGDWVPWDWRIQ